MVRLAGVYAWHFLILMDLENCGRTILHLVKDQACHKSGVISP
jgi:hypothetical protein